MTYFVLDTNILIKDPEIITRWSPNYEIIIPRFIFPELDRVTSRLGPLKEFWRIIEQSTKTGFVTVLDREIKIPEELFGLNQNQRLSYIDLQLCEFVRQLNNEGKKAILVTNDRALRVFSVGIDINTFDLIQFRNFISSLKTTSLEQLNKNETLKQYQNRRFILGLIFGIGLTIGILLIKNYFNEIYETINIWGTVILILFVGIVFFLFRINYRMFYGLIEFLFGFYISIRIFTEKSFDYHSIGIIEIAQIITGIYVMVRGLTNLDDGVMGTRFEPIWKRITRWRKFASR